MARRNIYDKPLQLAGTDRLQVLTDGVNVPAWDKGRGRLYYVPRLANILTQSQDRRPVAWPRCGQPVVLGAFVRGHRGQQGAPIAEGR